MKQRLLIYFALILASLLSACTRNGDLFPAQSVKPGWERFQTENLSIQLPSNYEDIHSENVKMIFFGTTDVDNKEVESFFWTEDQQSKTYFEFSALDTVNFPDKISYLNVINEYLTFPTALSDYIEYYFSHSTQNVYIFGEEERTIGDYTGYIVESRIKYNGKDLSGLLFVTMQGKDVWMFTYICPYDEYKDYQPIFVQSMETIQIR